MASLGPLGWRTALLAVLLTAVGLGTAPGAPVGRIAFAVDVPGGAGSRIYLAASDGSGARPVSPGAGRDRAPAFSPDGRRLAFQSTNELGLDTLFVVSLDEPAPGEALPMPRRIALGAAPQWSRDGRRLLFTRRQQSEDFLYVIAADGSQPDENLKPIARGVLGRWSPDEKQLAVVVPVIAEGRDRWQIQVMPAPAGAAPEPPEPTMRLTLPESFGQVVSLEWSPDGRRLLLSTARQNQSLLFVVDMDSPSLRRVPAGDGAPDAAYGSWSPDGTEILFRTADGPDETARHRLCVMRADGTDVRVLWEAPAQGLRIAGTAWHHPPTAGEVPEIAAKPAPKPQEAAPRPQPPAPPPPAVREGAPPQPPSTPAPVRVRVPGPARKLHGAKDFSIEHARSPVSVRLAAPGEADFAVTVPVLPLKGAPVRVQGVGFTLDMADGSLYRGTVIHNGVPWATIQGRPKGGRVRVLRQQLLPAGAGFPQGFKLTVRREGENLILAINDTDLLSRAVLSGPVRSLSLTLENLERQDRGPARFSLGNIYYREWIEGKP